MKRFGGFLVGMVTFLLAGPATAAGCASLAQLRWLLGDWAADGSKTVFHESWVELGPRTFEGTGIERASTAGAVKGSESLRLVEMTGGVFYISKVTHNELPVAFRLTGCADGRFVFENKAHDFPRMLEYRRQPNGRLAVRVSDGAEKGFTLDFSRRTAAADPASTVLASEDARFAAMIAADAEGMRHAFADDLVYIHSTGKVENREQLIASITSGRTPYNAVSDLIRETVMLAPDVALVRGQGRFQVVAGKTPLDLRLRYAAVYGRADGVWRLRSWHSVRQP